MSGWRAFVGEPGHRTTLDVPGLSWLQAQRMLLATLADDYPEAEPDTCEHCAAAARAAVRGLRDLPAETPGQWDVDRDEYILSRDLAGRNGEAASVSNEPGHEVSRGKPRLYAQITFYAESPIDYEAAVERVGRALDEAGFADRTEAFAELIQGDEPDGAAA